MRPESTTVAQKEGAEAPFITFYSFKGGVGRSMALINVAGIIAARGFRVLVIDMDLEAPGLSFLANPGERDVPEAREQPGFVDFLLDAVESRGDADLFALPPTDVIARYSSPYELPEGFSHNPQGLLRIMPAGRLDTDYSRRLERLDLPGLYRDGAGLPLLEAFKQTIRDSKLFDYVFVDSRTGFSDESGICTRDLADCLVVVSGLNKQNIEGTTRLLATLRRSSNRPSLLEVVLSPIPNGEDALVDEREALASEAFSGAWGAALRTDLHIPYHPQLALTEEPHIFRRRRGYLFDAYHRIERRLRDLLGHTSDVWLEHALDAYRAKDYDSAVAYLRRIDMVAETRKWADQFALTAGLADPNADSLYEFVVDKLTSHVRATVGEQLGEAAMGFWNQQDFDAAEALFKRAIASGVPVSDTVGMYAAFLWQVRGDLHTPEPMFAQALLEDPDDANHLANYGGFCICAGRVDQGLAHIQRVLNTGRLRGRSPLATECWMYVYCCGAPELREEALCKLKWLVERSVSTEDWDFSCVIEQARVLEHPHQQWLPVLADVLAQRESSTALADWDAWREASPEPHARSVGTRRAKPSTD